MKSFSTTHTTTKNISSGIKSSSMPHTEITSIWTTRTKFTSICMLALKPSDFGPAYKNQVNFDRPHNKINFIPTLKSSQIRSPTLKSSQFGPTTQQPSQSSCLSWKQVIFGQHTSDKVNFYHRHNNQINSSLHWNKVKFKNQVKFCSPHKTKLISTPTLKSSQFRSPH